MHLRIAHQLSLLLAAAVVLAVALVGGLSLWNLRSGFVDYMRLRDEEQLTRFVQLVERRAVADPSMAWLQADRQALRELVDEFYDLGARDGPPLRRPPPEREPPGWSTMPPPPPPREGPGRVRRPPPPGGPGGSLGERIVVRDAQGEWLAGRPQPLGARRLVRAVVVSGADVASVELSIEAVPDGLDARFLQRQYTGLLWAALTTISLAVLAAWWVAGRWSRPLRQLQQATHRIARGESGVQLDVATVGRGAVEIDELLADVNAMVLSLGAMEASRRRWIAQISHELRTPLSVLRGEMESIEDGARAPTPGVMASLREEVVQLTRLVDDLHMLSMADINQLSCSFAAGDISEALARMTRRFETRATQLGLSLLFKAGAPALVAHWDWGRIEQLLSNLLENSLRYTNAPGQIQVHWRLQ
ncbi:MAG: HAMP domain-containing protein, partial [Betaproteobacteria bacterium]|nr:HAMP domain-containing protein [Betaproteobacteria bacterium]